MLQEIEEEKTKRISNEERCIEILKKNIEFGLSREEAISKTGEKLGIEPSQMLQILKEYMIKKKKVRETKDGEYVLGE